MTKFILSMCINFVILAGMVARVVSNIVVVPIDCSKFCHQRTRQGGQFFPFPRKEQGNLDKW